MVFIASLPVTSPKAGICAVSFILCLRPIVKIVLPPKFFPGNVILETKIQKHAGVVQPTFQIFRDGYHKHTNCSNTAPEPRAGHNPTPSPSVG